MIDAVSKSLALIGLTLALTLAETSMCLGMLAALAGVAVLVTRPPAALIGVAVLVPALPIAISHFVIEPFPHLWPIGSPRVEAAVLPLLRFSSMTLASIAWLRSMTNAEFAQLCNSLRVGQSVYALGLAVSGMLSVQRARWWALRDVMILRRRGKARQRGRFRLSTSVPIGLHLTFATFSSLADTALATAGRGILSGKSLAVPVSRINGYGLALLLAVGAWIALAYRVGILGL